MRRDVKINQRGEVVAVYRILRVLTERKTAAKKGKYSAIEPATSYSDEEMQAIEDVYAAERVQGAEKRWFESVEKGDSVGTAGEGPADRHRRHLLSTPAAMASCPMRPPPTASRTRIASAFPAFYVKNEHGIPDVAQRLHWDPVWAQAIGNPMAYDYGVMRENYLWQYLSDWAGDDAVITHIHDEIRKFNYMGDVQRVTGEVLAKRQEGGQNLRRCRGEIHQPARRGNRARDRDDRVAE